MRRELFQFISVVAIAVGAGLFAFGRHLAPPFDATNPATAAIAMNVSTADREAASVACGFGVCFMTFGILGLAIPWINMTVARQCERSGTHPS